MQDIGTLNSNGEELYAFIRRLYPICRSITGNGVRQTLAVIQEYIQLQIHEVPSGTKVFDWIVPKEWNIHDAYIKDSSGRKIVDFQKSNLHVVNYSVPVKRELTLQELKNHLHTLPEQPGLIPYRTTYYNETWGFSLPHSGFEAMRDETYEVCIDSSLTDGHLTYGEFFIPGATDKEVLFSCHICHPSLCNDNLSGISVITHLAQMLQKMKLRYSYRFLFIPATIGSITWLALNKDATAKIRHGLVAANLGDSGHLTYKKSRRGDAEIDRVTKVVLRDSGKPYTIKEFFPYGYDERQFCSPGFNLPVGSIMRTPHGEYPEYHTSADNLDFIAPKNLDESLRLYISVLFGLENNDTYINQYSKCEPQLGKRGLYQAIGGSYDGKSRQLAMLWILNLSDGNNTLLDISEKSNIGFDVIRETADLFAF